MKLTLCLLAMTAASLPAANQYYVHNLVADVPGQGDQADANLVGPRGIAESPTGPFWVANNQSGTSTVYNTAGTVQSLVVAMPKNSQGSNGAVTGLAFNSTSSFTMAAGSPAIFLFCTEDGAITGWNSAVDATNAKVLVDRSSEGAIYTGCTVGGSSTAPIFYAANFHDGTIEAWDGTFQPITLASGSFTDAQVPAGFAPFNIQNLGGKLYVAYALQNADKTADSPGAGNGYLAAFDMSGNLLTHLVSKGPLNSPWGLALAPSVFGDFGGALLAGNSGDGTIHAFDSSTGATLGSLNDPSGIPIAIDGLWGLLFGNGGSGGDPGTLYFTAGTSGANAATPGVFGSIQAAPSFPAAGVANAASYSTTLAPNSWGTVIGEALSATTRGWLGSDFVNNKLPAQLDTVSVTINGEPAYVDYISPGQINFLIPSDVAPGPVQVAVSNHGLTSATQSATISAAAPSFFLLSGNYIAATHADGSLSGPPSLISGVATTPVVPGETVVLYGNGFGPTSPATPNGQIVTGALNLASPLTLTIGGLPATVSFAGLSSTGLYQINAIVPSVASTGGAQTDAPVVATVMGLQSPSTSLLSVAAPNATTGAVSISNFAFVPTPITVAAGTNITWTNTDGVQHTVTADDGSFGSAKLATNGTFSQKITTPGTYNYHCSIHSFMHGTVVVQ